MIGNHSLVHRHDGVQHRHGASAHGGDEVPADPDPLLFLVLAQKLGDLLHQLLYKPQVFIKDVVHGAIRHPMGSSQVHAHNPVIRVHVGGDSGDDVLSPLGFLCVQVLLIVGHFAFLNFLQDVVNSGFRQRLVLKSGISEAFDFVSTFSGSGKASNDIAHLRQSDSWEG
jgi:hypothetical protein